MKQLILGLIAAVALAGTATAATETKKPAAKTSKTAKASSKGKAAAAPVAPPKASDEQVAALGQADLGDYTCEFNERIQVQKHPQYDGYVQLSHRNKHYLMKPVVSNTGAIRLEDLKGQMLMIQIATKAMFMDTKLGQRLADGCLRPGDAQRATS